MGLSEKMDVLCQDYYKCSQSGNGQGLAFLGWDPLLAQYQKYTLELVLAGFLSMGGSYA